MLIVDSDCKTMKTTDVSVIIPTYNRVSMLEEALASVFAQEFDGTIEIIVVDDNSQDGTSEFVRQNYPNVILISLQENLGAYLTRNKALMEARGKYIAFLDSDDLWDSKYLQSQISTLESKEKCFVISALSIINTTDKTKFINYQKPRIERFLSPIHQLIVSSSFIYLSSVVFSRYIFEDIGLFDETFRVGADREFYLRCLLNGYQLIWTEKPLAIWRQHNQGQLTNYSVSKIKLRRQTRITYLQKHSSAIEKHLSGVLFRRLYAEIHLTAAREFFNNKYYLHWILSYREVVKHTSLNYAFLNMMRDILRPVKKFLPSNVLIILRKIFLSNALST